MSKMRSTTIVIDKVLKIMTRKCPAASGGSPVSVGVPLGNSLGDGQICHALALPGWRTVAAIWMVICAVGLSSCAAFGGRVLVQPECPGLRNGVHPSNGAEFIWLERNVRVRWLHGNGSELALRPRATALLAMLAEDGMFWPTGSCEAYDTLVQQTIRDARRVADESVPGGALDLEAMAVGAYAFCEAVRFAPQRAAALGVSTAELRQVVGGLQKLLREVPQPSSDGLAWAACVAHSLLAEHEEGVARSESSTGSDADARKAVGRELHEVLLSTWNRECVRGQNRHVPASMFLRAVVDGEWADVAVELDGAELRDPEDVLWSSLVLRCSGGREWSRLLERAVALGPSRAKRDPEGGYAWRVPEGAQCDPVEYHSMKLILGSLLYRYGKLSLDTLCGLGRR